MHIAAAVSTAAVVGLIAAALLGAQGVMKHARLRHQLSEVRRMNADLAAENERMAAEASALRKDMRYVARTIRRELGWIADDEVVVVFEE